jgi:hypothetical protein
MGDADPGVGKERVAVASMEGLFINLPLEEATALRVYDLREGQARLMALRPLPPPQLRGIQRWRQAAALLADCGAVLVYAISPAAHAVLLNAGLRVVITEGPLDLALAGLRSRPGGPQRAIPAAPRPFSAGPEGDENACDDDPPY